MDPMDQRFGDDELTPREFLMRKRVDEITKYYRAAFMVLLLIFAGVALGQHFARGTPSIQRFAVGSELPAMRWQLRQQGVVEGAVEREGFVLARDARGRVSLLDREGTILWKQPPATDWEPPRAGFQLTPNTVEIYIVDGTKRLLILIDRRGGSLVTREFAREPIDWEALVEVGGGDETLVSGDDRYELRIVHREGEGGGTESVLQLWQLRPQ